MESCEVLVETNWNYLTNVSLGGRSNIYAPTFIDGAVSLNEKRKMPYKTFVQKRYEFFGVGSRVQVFTTF